MNSRSNSPRQAADHSRPHRRGPFPRLRDHRNRQIALRVSRDVIKAKSAPYLHRGKPARQRALTNGSDHTIVATYGAIYGGIVHYYLLVGDFYRPHRLRWVMETFMLKTLAGKHRSTVSKMAKPTPSPSAPYLAVPGVASPRRAVGARFHQVHPSRSTDHAVLWLASTSDRRPAPACTFRVRGAICRTSRTDRRP
jgi:hypothetical protein